MIKAYSVEKSFGTLKVLKSLDFAVAKGEVVSIVGASGAGKSTLLQIIGSLLPLDSGQVIVDGVDIFTLNEIELAKFRNQKMGFVFQFHHLLPEFTAIENVMIPALIAKTKKRDAYKRAKDLLQEIGLGERLNHKPSELSGGEQQRVAVARALINGPEVILADEPSGNLDTMNKEELHRLFFDLRDKFNQTFVIVTHDMSLAQMSDRTITMQDGVIQ